MGRRKGVMYFSVIHKPRFIELPPRPTQMTMVCGTGRSGTTWIGDVIASKTKSRTLFEPWILDENNMLQMGYLASANMSARRESPFYISAKTPISPSVEHQIRKVLFGHHQYGWVNQNLKSGFYMRRLVKEIRANLTLSVIARLWPEIRIVYIIRSPYKVVDSMIDKMRAGWLFEWKIEDILRQEDLVEDWLSPFVNRIERAKSLPERLMVRWCIENHVVANQLRDNDNVLFVGYEQLRAGIGWTDVGTFLGDRGWVGKPRVELLNSPSRTAARPLESRGGDAYKHLDKNAVLEITDLLHVFGLTETLPDMSHTWAGNQRPE